MKTNYGLKSGFLIFCLISGINQPLLAQLVPDNTLGSENSVVTPIDNLNQRIDGGARRGANLFHSFQQFNINEGRGVYFSNPSGIDNILTRVTGSNASRIMGKLGVLGGANLFLLNPNGIFFGSNASLDIQGSFIGTTADRIYLGENHFFSASDPQNSSLLAISPGVLFFNQANQQPGNIINRANLTVGKDLTLAAPNLTITGQLVAGGNLTLQGTEIETNTELISGGNFRVEQLDGSLGNLTSLDGTVIRAGGDVFLNSYQGASLHILVGGKVEIPDYVNITGASKTNGLVETITLSDGTTVLIDGQNQPTLDIRAGIKNARNTGTNADISTGTIVFATLDQEPIKGNVLLTNQYQPNTALTGNIQIAATIEDIEPLQGIALQNGDFEGGGTVTIDAKDSLAVNGSVDVSALDRHILNDNIPENTFKGNGGNVKFLAEGDIIFAPGVFLTSIGLLGGNLTFKSEGNISIDSDNKDESYIITNSFSRVPDAKSGDINLTAKTLLLNNEAELSTSTSGKVNAGNVYIQVADKITLDSGSVLGSSVEGNSETAHTLGKSGNVYIQSNSLILKDFSDIDSILSGVGNSGNIFININNLMSLSGGSSIRSDTYSEQGNSGNITINASNADLISLSGGSFIRSNINSVQGNSGSITINALNAVINIDGVQIIKDEEGNFVDISTLTTAVNLEAPGIGDAGNINIVAKSLSLTNGATIDSHVDGTGNAGNVEIEVTDSLIINGGSRILTFLLGRGNAGNIIINAPNANISIDGIATLPFGFGLIKNEEFFSGIISIVDFFPNTEEKEGNGNAGNIEITAKTLSLTNGGQLVTNNFATGNSGDIIVRVSDTMLLNGGSTIRTDILGKGEAGKIIIDAPNADLFFDGIADIPFFFPYKNETRIETSPSGVSSSVTEGVGQAGEGAANDIIITAKTLSLSNGAEISASIFGEGARITTAGNININVPIIRLERGSNIRTNIKTGNTEGGNITINASDSIIAFDDSNILAFSRDSRGGNIILNTPVFFGENYDPRISAKTDTNQLENNGRVDINATGTISGIIRVPDLSFIQNSLTDLPAVLINTETLLVNSCVTSSQDEEGKFIINGSGGIPERPGMNSVSPYPTEDVQTTDDNASSRPWQLGDPIVEPQSFYRLANGKLVLSRQCS